jgi:hypothetical protein
MSPSARRKITLDRDYIVAVAVAVAVNGPMQTGL